MTGHMRSLVGSMTLPSGVKRNSAMPISENHTPRCEAGSINNLEKYIAAGISAFINCKNYPTFPPSKQAVEERNKKKQDGFGYQERKERKPNQDQDCSTKNKKEEMIKNKSNRPNKFALD